MAIGRDDTKQYVRPANDKSAIVPADYREQRLLEISEEARNFATMKMGERPIDASHPKASPQTGYYGIHLLKSPQWTWMIPVYFFVGGLGGSSAVIAEAARMTGWNEDSKIVRDARTVSALGAIISPALLVFDLGRPSRFLNMLRVFKKQSPMSVGVYIVSIYSTFSVLTKFHEFLLQRLHIFPIRLMQELTSTLSAIFGFGMASYTGVLICTSAIPVWNEHRKSLPIHFAFSGVGAAVGTLELMGNENRALNFLGLGAATMECIEGLNIERQSASYAEPLKKGFSGWLIRAGGMLSGPVPFALRAAALFTSEKRSRQLRRYAAISSIAGSLITREAWVRAGKASAEDYRLPLHLAPDQQDLPDQWRPNWADETSPPDLAKVG